MKSIFTTTASVAAAALLAFACSDGAEESAASGAAGAGTSAPDIPMTRSGVAYDTNPAISEADYATFLSQTSAFGLDLFHAFAEDDNAFLSPTSTIVALAMTYGGARGETASQMAAAMHSSLEPDIFHAAVNRLTIDLAERNIALHDTQEGKKSLELSLVQGAFAQKDYVFLDSYLDLLSVNYDAGLYLLDFAGDATGSRDAINQWVAFHTRDRIEELLGAGSITPMTRLVLTNTVYFYGSWMQVFDEDATSDAAFRTLSGSEVTVPTMHGDLQLSYGVGDGYQILDLPYDGEKVRMTVVVPEAGRFEEIRDSLTTDWLSTARAGMESETDVALALPKFSFTWGTESFAGALQGMGMVDAFNPQTADFSGMDGSRELYVDDVWHQAFVAVDEDGTEAAAATAVVVDLRATPEPVDVTVDRPFILFITDESGAMLFAGQVTDPTDAT